VELHLIADVGLIGFPNAGKSTLLRRLTRAEPKVAPYPFTTLAPELGTVMYRDAQGTQVRVADLPGLIESAHLNRGLGIEFLRHVTRTNTLAVVLDMAGSEARSPWQDFTVLCRELEHYRPGLSKQIRLIIGNKMDLPDAARQLRAFRAKLKDRADLAHVTLWALSAKEGGLELEDLAEHLKELVHGAESEPEFKTKNLLPHSDALSAELHEQERQGFSATERLLPDPQLGDTRIAKKKKRTLTKKKLSK
jgi:GTP-binding protein